MGKEIFNKDPIFPHSNKKEPAVCSKLVELTPPVLAALADPKSAKPTSASAEPIFLGLGAIGVSPVDSVPIVVDMVPAGVEKLSRGRDLAGFESLEEALFPFL
ncbi:unnamed protein product [Miscanthus lutarioriparius]|uniref:Uncharacterized protein n=1 Tax=Miscanthus lutarioriparius TaxID=422564 RepID=A0A811P5L7_9POAL|nr:unnamed protein product [Miscanthus lutarioriparius]